MTSLVGTPDESVRPSPLVAGRNGQAISRLRIVRDSGFIARIIRGGRTEWRACFLLAVDVSAKGPATPKPGTFVIFAKNNSSTQEGLSPACRMRAPAEDLLSARSSSGSFVMHAEKQFQLSPLGCRQFALRHKEPVLLVQVEYVWMYSGFERAW